ncbi:hypothetical protein L1987_85863 [Smallanthus sonchifolius]|uniref:Uncharacterized protein n=1 Tax=Smallanthus sonchifolius TaxID=185202 RepID=A0ACB8XY57_9ASTR|nr:hypothetical protein L1987_85863 [Smallanthus sonchifolius]
MNDITEDAKQANFVNNRPRQSDCLLKLKRETSYWRRPYSQFGLLVGKIEEVTSISTYVPIISWEYVDGNLVLKRENGSVENFNSIDLLCINKRSPLNLAELPMVNEEKNEKANCIE